MASAVNSGARLDRLPISSFHYRIFWLVGAGMFFDGYDLYVGTAVLPALLQSKFSTLPLNGWFVSLTFLGMTIGALVTGFLGDRYGRRFTYQFNLMIFGLASLAAAFAPDMWTLNALRLVMGLGLGAEIVVGYSTLTEFVPPASRGRWLAFMAFLVVSGLPVTTLLGNLIIPGFGWRPMFVIAGVGALIVWYLRKALPEIAALARDQRTRRGGRSGIGSNRERGLSRGAAAGAGRAGAGAEIRFGFALPGRPPAAHARGELGADHGQHPDLRVRDLAAAFFVAEGLTVTRSLAYTLVIVGSPIGCAIGAYCADAFGRRPTIIGASVLSIIFGSIYPFASTPALMLPAGFLLIVAIYIQRRAVRGLYAGAVPDRGAAARQRYLQHAWPRRHRGVAVHRDSAVPELQDRRRIEPDDRAVADPDRRRGHDGNRNQPARPRIVDGENVAGVAQWSMRR